MTSRAADFIQANTVVVAPPLVPEIKLHLAAEIAPIWQATEAALQAEGVAPPFWAFCWPGGQALARHVLDQPGIVRGKRVLDFAAGSGVAAIAAALAGAAHVVANDIDAYSLEAARTNAQMNDVAIDVSGDDLVGRENDGWDVVLAGDVCYERPMSTDVTRWLRALAADGTEVLIGDPGRTFLPADGLEEVARHDVPTSLELEDREIRTTVVWRILPG